jgi:pheromone shutdown protein TraB
MAVDSLCLFNRIDISIFFRLRLIKDKVVVAVVGAAHVNGIEKYWNSGDQIDIDAVSSPSIYQDSSDPQSFFRRAISILQIGLFLIVAVIIWIFSFGKSKCLRALGASVLLTLPHIFYPICH